MVNTSQRYLIDATYIFRHTTAAFTGSPLLVADGKDHTFIYGFMRDLLRARRVLGIASGILVVGSEGNAAAAAADVTSVVEFAKVLGIPVVYSPQRSVLDICYHISDGATHLITGETKLMQLTTQRLSIIRPKPRDEYECLTPASVSSQIGVEPLQIPTFLALHNSQNEHKNTVMLTKKQAVRLVEVYGGLENIYANLDEINASVIRDKLALGRDAIMRTYSHSKVDASPIDVAIDANWHSWRFDNRRVPEALHAHRFHSLVRLLPLPYDVRPPGPVENRETNAYKAVQDRKSLHELEVAVCGSEVCALDTESDDKDPRKAKLLGVAISVRPGTAFFVPLTDSDLKDISRDEVIASLKMLLDKRRCVVGHNIKYDALLLRRHGLVIGNIYFDTMLAAYERYGDLDFFNLGYLCERLLGKRIKSYSDIVRRDQTFLDLPFNEMKDHGCQDADFTLRLYSHLDKELNSKNIREQFANTTMKMARKLAEYEFHGVSISLRKLEQAREALFGQIKIAKDRVWEILGKKVDLDSGKELASALKDHLEIRTTMGTIPLSLRHLEELAIPYRDVRPVVEYKRLCKQLKHLESISESSKSSKVYPSFNQVRSSSGRLSSSNPSLFDDNGLVTLSSCITSTGLREFFPNQHEAVDRIAAESKDTQLRSDRRKRCGTNSFMAEHPALKELNHDEFLLSLVSGESGPNMSRRYTLERMRVESACHDLKLRYSKLFEWLSEFREDAARHGYVTGPKGIKYLAGLVSSNIEKRRKAMDASVRWRIGW